CSSPLFGMYWHKTVRDVLALTRLRDEGRDRGETRWYLAALPCSFVSAMDYVLVLIVDSAEKRSTSPWPAQRTLRSLVQKTSSIVPLVSGDLFKGEQNAKEDLFAWCVGPWFLGNDCAGTGPVAPHVARRGSDRARGRAQHQRAHRQSL